MSTLISDWEPGRWSFYSYDPFMTYGMANKHFVDRNGKPAFIAQKNDPEWMSEDDVALWRLGRDAYLKLPPCSNKEEFDASLAEHYKMIKGLRTSIAAVAIEKRVVFKNEDDQPIEPDFDDFTSMGILEIAWKLVKAGAADAAVIKNNFLFACLESIEHGLIANHLDGGGVYSAIEAANAFANFVAIDSGSTSLQQARSEIGLAGALERYRDDPKQEAKKFIKECWIEWQRDSGKYPKQSAFASDMLTKIPTDKDGSPIISFDTIVKKWIPIWTRESK
ncbi:MAG: hypothetical protein JWR22_1299 [Herminiimonas sp.]|nr:hypothetical protein [Herminiimonas sp.]